MSVVDSVIVSFSVTEKPEDAILLVGRKSKGRAADIVNAFQGAEAVELYKKLTENLRDCCPEAGKDQKKKEEKKS